MMMRQQQQQQHHHHDHQEQRDQATRMFYELSALVLNMLRSPPSPVSFPEQDMRFPTQITPSGFASLLLGVSLALMLCGSVTFFIGFMLMPWVIAFAMVFSFLGFVSTISLLGRSFFGSSRKHVPAWKLL